MRKHVFWRLEAMLAGDPSVVHGSQPILLEAAWREFGAARVLRADARVHGVVLLTDALLSGTFGRAVEAERLARLTELHAAKGSSGSAGCRGVSGLLAGIGGRGGAVAVSGSAVGPGSDELGVGAMLDAPEPALEDLVVVGDAGVALMRGLLLLGAASEVLQRSGGRAVHLRMHAPEPLLMQVLRALVPRLREQLARNRSPRRVEGRLVRVPPPAPALRGCAGAPAAQPRLLLGLAPSLRSALRLSQRRLGHRSRVARRGCELADK